MQRIGLVILAAGLGSRFGGVKQLQGVGPNNELLIDYAIFDAIRSAYSYVVFIISPSMESEFKEIFNRKFGDKIDLRYTVQDNAAYLPAGVEYKARRKPWGTGHAILCAQDNIDSPYVTINADDFYGREPLELLAAQSYAVGDQAASAGSAYMLAYKLKNTLSPSGSVSRGLCKIDQEGMLSSIRECHNIEREHDIITTKEAAASPLELRADTLVSMNLFALENTLFEYMHKQFKNFIQSLANINEAEFYLPSFLNKALKDALLTVRVLETDSIWFGMTYAHDLEYTKTNIIKLIENAEYPKNLFNKLRN